MVSLKVIMFSTKGLLFVYMYIDLLKFKAYKAFENSDADLSWLLFFFKEANLDGRQCPSTQGTVHQQVPAYSSDRKNGLASKVPVADNF